MMLAAALIKVLIITGQSDLASHDWRQTTPVIRAELEQTRRFDVKVVEEPRGLTREALSGYDVILFNYNGPRFPAAAEQAIEDFVRSGGGFVSFHGATYGELVGQVQKNGRWTAPADGGKGWAAYSEMIGATWKLENLGHALRHVFPVRWTEKTHPIAQGLDEKFIANDELYHKLDLLPGTRVLATAYSDPAQGGTGKDEPMVWTTTFGKGRCVHTPLGHDLSALAQPGLSQTLTRAVEWAATGAIAPQLLNMTASARVLVVTGGHAFPHEFFTLFEDMPGVVWRYASSTEQAFAKPLLGTYDTIVFHDMGETIGEKQMANLRAFVEAGGGIVSTHHSIVNYTSWPWWYEQVIGGKYFVQPIPGHPKSSYKEDVPFVATVVKAAAKHPVVRGVPPLPVIDEVYKDMWRAPGIQVLMETDHPLNDRPVVYAGPHPKARVVYIQLGHGAETMRYPGYRKLIHNAVLWTAKHLE